jgi:tRNA(Ile)-lysidine synthase TilS/MesJ
MCFYKYLLMQRVEDKIVIEIDKEAVTGHTPDDELKTALHNLSSSTAEKAQEVVQEGIAVIKQALKETKQ